MLARWTGLVLVVLLTTATSCGVPFEARQGFESFPALDCVAAALNSSPSVMEQPHPFHDDGAEGFQVVLRDSTGRGGERRVLVYRQVRRSPSDTLRVSLVFPGRKPPPAYQLGAAGAVILRVLQDVARACAPNDTSTATCALNGRASPCAPQA
jgi:hypothetical protein